MHDAKAANMEFSVLFVLKYNGRARGGGGGARIDMRGATGREPRTDVGVDP